MSASGPFDLTDAARQVLAFREARDWAQFHRPKELAAALAIEAAELQQVFLWQASVPASDIEPARLASAREEVADCAIYLVLLAHELGIDLRAAVEDKLAANAARYTVEDYRGSATKAPKR